MYWSVKGGGAFCNGVRLQPKDRTSIHPEDTLGFTSSQAKKLNIGALAGRIRCIGSIAIEFVYAAHGRLCSHVGGSEGINDLAASICIVQEAGCGIEYLDGSEWRVEDMVREGRMRSTFIVAPPQMRALLKSTLASR
jgi:fructose-1,6-bisphosphatase/inositol monophosphatase family enzyme